MNFLALLMLGALAASTHAALHLCCSCGDDSETGASWSRPLNTLGEAIQRASASGEAILMAGRCQISSTLTFNASHSNISITGVYGIADPPEISGGMQIPYESFVPVTDPAVLARLPPSAAGKVVQLNLTEQSVVPGTLTCRPYEGTDAGILPNGIMPTALELFWPGNPFAPAGISSPLELARYPNRVTNALGWTHFTWAPNGQPAAVDNVTAARLAAWEAELARAPGSVFVHYNNPIGWADLHFAVSSITPPAGSGSNGTLGLAPCVTAAFPPNYDTIEAGAYMYTYNLLPELDAEGEYVLDIPSNTLYVWPPSQAASPIWQFSTWGLPVVQPEGVGLTAGAPRLGAHDTATLPTITAWDGNLMNFIGTSSMTFEGVTFSYTRGIALNIVNSTGLTFINCTVINAGAMAVNISGTSSDITFDGALVRDAGNGGIYSYAGDRPSLTPANNLVIRSSVSYNNRYMFCYVPLIALGGVATTVESSEIFGQAHMGIFNSGNNHLLLGNYVHDVVQSVRDSGAFYMGRDWTYRGTRILNNTFTRINSLFTGDDVSAVYLDDSASGTLIQGNTFINVSRALLLGGGRDNLFLSNVVHHAQGTDAAIHFDDRDLGWASNSCKPGGLPYDFLYRVPFNSSSVWISSYPTLATILQNQPCVPMGNVIVGNTLCDAPGLPWIDVSNSTINSWGSTAWGNTNTTC